MNDFAKLALSFEAKNLPIKHIPGPEGVRGRNSDNQMIKEKLGWAPSIPVAEGLKKTYFWIKDQVEKDKAAALSVVLSGEVELRAGTSSGGAVIRTFAAGSRCTGLLELLELVVAEAPPPAAAAGGACALVAGTGGGEVRLLDLPIKSLRALCADHRTLMPALAEMLLVRCARLTHAATWRYIDLPPTLAPALPLSPSSPRSPRSAAASCCSATESGGAPPARRRLRRARASRRAAHPRAW